MKQEDIDIWAVKAKTDEKAFEELIEAITPLIYKNAHAVAKLVRTMSVEDIAQELKIAAWTAVQYYDNTRSYFLYYVHKFISQRCWLLKKEYLEDPASQFYNLEALNSDEKNYEDIFGKSQPSHFTDEYEEERVRKIISPYLRDIETEVFILFYIRGFKPRHISAWLEKEKGEKLDNKTASRHAIRALQKLRENKADFDPVLSIRSPEFQTA